MFAEAALGEIGGLIPVSPSSAMKRKASKAAWVEAQTCPLARLHWVQWQTVTVFLTSSTSNELFRNHSDLSASLSSPIM